MDGSGSWGPRLEAVMQPSRPGAWTVGLAVEKERRGQIQCLFWGERGLLLGGQSWMGSGWDGRRSQGSSKPSEELGLYPECNRELWKVLNGEAGMRLEWHFREICAHVCPGPGAAEEHSSSCH